MLGTVSVHVLKQNVRVELMGKPYKTQCNQKASIAALLFRKSFQPEHNVADTASQTQQL